VTPVRRLGGSIVVLTEPRWTGQNGQSQMRRSEVNRDAKFHVGLYEAYYNDTKLNQL